MHLLKIGITHGDINGISYEILLKLLQVPEILEIFTPVIFGSEQVAAQTARQLGIEPLRFNVIQHAADATDGCINLVPVCSEAEPEVQFGQQTEAALQAEAQSLTAALAAYSQQDIDALVTLPGHLDNDTSSNALTDFIRRALSVQEDTFEWTICGPFRMIVLRPMDVSTELGTGLASEAFQNHLKAIGQSLRQDYGKINPRMAVVSSLPRLRSDVEELHEAGVMAFGPFEAAAFAEGGWQQHYDVNILLGEPELHDRLLHDAEADQTVGYVSGLPLVLTYPFQDIAYADAGRGVTSEVPLREAIYAAIDIVRSRASYRRATHRPLEKQWVPRGRDDFKLDLTKEE